MELLIEGADATGYSVQVGETSPLEVTETISRGERRSVEVELREGANTIAVEVLDERGVAGMASTVVFFERPLAPLIELTAPEDGWFTLQTSVLVEGQVLTSRAATATMQLRNTAPIALQLVPSTDGYTFSAAAGVELGQNTIIVEATDDLGNSVNVQVTVTREIDDVAPIAEVLFPREGQGIKTRRVLVRGASGRDPVVPMAARSPAAKCILGDATISDRPVWDM